MDRLLWILLVIALVAVLLVLASGVAIFIRGGETNRRWGNFMMNLRVGAQGTAVLILAVIFLLRWLHPGGH